VVKLLKPEEIDVEQEAVDQVMTAAEEAAELAQFAPTSTPGDLSDGGVVNGVRIHPMSGVGGEKMKQGRPAARRAWSWNGTESLLTLAWNPEGNRHDGARHYLLKRHCLCCKITGFIGRQCPSCVKSRCVRCNGSADHATPHTLGNGKVVKGWLIPAFYLRPEDVPFPERFYGDVPCFLTMCPRREDRGFKTEEDMRMHAQSRHRMEYAAHLQTQQSRRRDEVDMLREELLQLRTQLANGNGHQSAAPAATVTQVVSTPTQAPVAPDAPQVKSPAQLAAIERMKAGAERRREAQRATRETAAVPAAT